MAIGVGQLDLNKYAALQSAKVAAPAMQPAAFGGGSVSPANIDVNAIQELARKNALAKTGTTTEAAAATSANPVSRIAQIQQPQVAKVDLQTVTSKFGTQPLFESAAKFRGLAAGDAYAKNASKLQGQEFGQYDGLKSFKTNETQTAGAASSSNPFAAAFANNGGNVTAGLNFGGINNLNPDQKMFIA